MSRPMTFDLFANAIFSPALADGVLRSGSRDGPMTVLSGPEAARANSAAAQREEETTQMTFGLNFAESSLQSALESCLASRLPVPSIGLTASAMTWRPWITKSGRQFCRLSVSVQTMRALGFTLYATPTATANQACPSMQKHPGCRGLEVSPSRNLERMGYPPDWLSCGERAMQSFHKSRRSS